MQNGKSLLTYSTFVWLRARGRGHYHITFFAPSYTVTISAEPGASYIIGGKEAGGYYDWVDLSGVYYVKYNSGTTVEESYGNAEEEKRCFRTEAALKSAWAGTRTGYLTKWEASYRSPETHLFVSKYCIRMVGAAATIRIPKTTNKVNYTDLASIDSIVQKGLASLSTDVVEIPNTLRRPNQNTYMGFFRQALSGFDAVLREYDPSNKKARIDHEVAANIWYNKAQLYVCMEDWTQAELALKEAEAMLNQYKIKEKLSNDCARLREQLLWRKQMHEMAPASQRLQR